MRGGGGFILSGWIVLDDLKGTGGFVVAKFKSKTNFGRFWGEGLRRANLALNDP